MTIQFPLCWSRLDCITALKKLGYRVYRFIGKTNAVEVEI